MRGVSHVTMKSISAVITKGTTPMTLGLAHASTGVPFLRAENIRDLSVVPMTDPLFIDSQTDNALRRSRIFPNDILISIAGTIGRVGVVPPSAPPMNCNQAVAIIRLLPTYDPRYVAHWLTSDDAKRQIKQAQVTATISNLSLGQLGELVVPAHSLPEQRRVARILDKADAIRRKRKEAIALTEELLRSTFLEMFGDPVTNPKGWAVSRLQELAEVIDYGVTASSTQAPVGPKFLRITDIQENRVEWNSVPYCECDETTGARAALREGDIVFARTGATTGKSFRIRQCPERAVFASYLIRVRPGTRVNSSFLAEFFQSHAYWNQIRSMAEGAAQPGVNASKLGELLVPVPPMSKQREFENVSEQVMAMQGQIEDAIVESDRLFESLVDYAFNGSPS